MKRCAPAAERNKGPLTDVLATVLPEAGRVLEVASGSGQHAAHFARAFPGITWLPSDASSEALPSIAAWVAEAGVANVEPPRHLDATADAWPDALAVDGVVCINMIHIAPWDACRGLFRHAAAAGAGWVFLYGPFFVEGVETAPSNLQFDAMLRSQNAAWGVRDLAAVATVAAEHGYALERSVAMPANNLSVVFTRDGRRRKGSG